MKADIGKRLQEARQGARLTQAELAARAGVSRALVSAVEAGRHLPRVDAAIALSRALGTNANVLFGPDPAEPVDAISGAPAPAGAKVRIGFVDDRPVTTPVRHGGDGWEAIDAVVGEGELVCVRPVEPQVVVAGCEPGLRVLERLLQARGTRAMAITTSSAAALGALASGRIHGAVLHFTEGAAPAELAEDRFLRLRLGRWSVGLAGAPGQRGAWWSDALTGRVAVIQREAGAGAQSAFERALRARGDGVGAGAGTSDAKADANADAAAAEASGAAAVSVSGPRVDSHLAASRLCLATGLPAVTIEPAAAAVGAAFHALESHAVELWIASRHVPEAGVARLLEAIHSSTYRRTLESVGGYDLSELGRRVA